MSVNLIWALLSGVLAAGLLALSVAMYWPGVADSPADDAVAATTSAAEYGKQLILSKGCGGCHTVPGVAGATGEFGPYLGGVGARPRIANGAVPNAGPADLERWILDPTALKPGTQMPRLGLTRPEAAAIVSYLETLR
jgi:cytochrome c1